MIGVSSLSTNDEKKLLNMSTNAVLPKSIEENLLSNEKQGVHAFKTFVDERISGTNKNLWDKMTKVKRHNWTDGHKSLNVKAGGKEVCVKAASSLFSRLLMVARSACDEVDLKEVIGVHEFSITNQMLMTADGRLRPSKDKFQLMKHLACLPQSWVLSHPTNFENVHQSAFVIDAMVVA